MDNQMGDIQALSSPSGESQKSDTAIEFPHFDVVLDESDHFFKSSKVKDSFSNASSSVSRSIMKEWKILEKDLPESIYVRAYETRIDLLRAVIVGSPGTPYHDGLFFFDIVFPSNYPKQPPKVHYLSRGLRLNPNLYASGKVCLSLINTWNGAKVERWAPSKSTILQLLVSIQGLVLNDKPYFNEPAFAHGRKKMSRSWINRSLAYNETVFLLSCKTMLHHMRTPPKNFEGFVSDHFCGRGDFILAAIESYGNGKVIVGQYRGDGQTNSSSRVKVPAAFQTNSKKMRVELQGAFKKLSGSADEPEVVEKAKHTATRKKGGFFQSIIKCILA